MDEEKAISKKDHKAARIVVVIILAIAIAVAIIFLIRPNIQAEKPDPSFVVLHSFPAGSPQVEYIEKTLLPRLEKQFNNLEAAAVYCDESKIDSEALRMKNEGKAPDVLFLPPNAMAGLAGLGILVPFNTEETPAEYTEIFEAFGLGSKTAGMIEEKTYGIPIDVSVSVLLYNPSLLPGAGGQPPENLDAFWSMLSTLSSGSGNKAGFILPDAGMKSLAPFVWSSGGELVNEEGTQAYGYLNNAKNTVIFDRFATAIENGEIVVAAGKEEALARFAAGESAMTLIDTSDVPSFTTQYPDFAFEVTVFPAGSSGSISVINCKYISITTDSRHDATIAFLLDISGSEIMNAEPAAIIPEEALASARSLPMSWSMSDMQNEFLLAMKQITDGYKTTQQALDDLAMKWDAYL